MHLAVKELRGLLRDPLLMVLVVYAFTLDIYTHATAMPETLNRATIGIVVIFGVTFSTLLSLYVVPAFYALLAPFTRSPEAVAHELGKLEAETPSVGGHG